MAYIEKPSAFGCTVSAIMHGKCGIRVIPSMTLAPYVLATSAIASEIRRTCPYGRGLPQSMRQGGVITQSVDFG